MRRDEGTADVRRRAGRAATALDGARLDRVVCPPSGNKEAGVLMERRLGGPPPCSTRFLSAAAFVSLGLVSSPATSEATRATRAERNDYR